MSDHQFVDYYEILQLSPNAIGETVERVYRVLAKRYHPDNQVSGDANRFSEVTAAYDVLSNPERRARYDAVYEEQRKQHWRIFDQKSAVDSREEDRRIFHGILSLLYIARRRDPENGGIGGAHLEKLLGVPAQHLEFPLWYLRQRKWIEILHNGQLAISIDGIDKLTGEQLSLPANRLLQQAPAVANEQPSTSNTAHRMFVDGHELTERFGKIH